MKDLYKRLHVSAEASADEIRQALATATPDDRAAAEYVLLEPARRRVYDRHHRLLTTIAHVRGRLALGLRPFWAHAHHTDFNVPFAAPRTPAGLRAMDVMEATSGRARRRSGRLAFLLVALVALGMFIVLAGWWLRHR